MRKTTSRVSKGLIGAQAQRPPAHMRRGVGGEHNDWHRHHRIEHRLQALQNLKPIEVGHVQVEQDQIRLQGDDGFQHCGGMAQRGQAVKAFFMQNAFEQTQVRRFIVHNQYFRQFKAGKRHNSTLQRSLSRIDECSKP